MMAKTRANKVTSSKKRPGCLKKDPAAKKDPPKKRKRTLLDTFNNNGNVMKPSLFAVATMKCNKFKFDISKTYAKLTTSNMKDLSPKDKKKSLRLRSLPLNTRTRVVGSSINS